MDSNFGNLSNDDLLALARQAGYLPEEKGAGEPEAVEPTSEPVTQPSQVPEGQTQPYLDPQGPTAPSSLPQGVPSVSKGSSVNMSGRGVNMGTYNSAGATMQRGVEGDVARADSFARNEDQPAIDSATFARDQSIQAEKNIAHAQVGGIEQEGRDALVMQRLQDDFAVEEARINAAATAQSNQSKADYLAALTDLRASRVDPAQLWHNMTGGERFGTLMSAFVHDFLGARGINTSAMDTLNKAIDRNIDAQVQAIHTKGDVAEGFKSLWYMQRNQAASDAEARARVRGFLLDGAKQAVIANMSQYKSALASAQGQAAIAKINDEFSKNLLDIYKHVDSNAVALRQQAIDIWKQRVQASIESRSVGVAERADARAAKNVNPPMPDLVYDPETGQAVGFFKQEVKPEVKDKFREELGASKTMAKDINALRELIRNSKPTIDGLGHTRFVDTDQKKITALATHIAHVVVKGYGERATEPDVQGVLEGLQNNTYLTQADMEKVAAFMQDRFLQPTMDKYEELALDLPSDSPYRQLRQGNGENLFQATRTDARNTSNPPPKGTETQHLEAAAKQFGPDRGTEELPSDENTGDVKKVHQIMQTEHPDLFSGGTKRYEAGIVETMRVAKGSDKAAAKQAVELLQEKAGNYLNRGIHDDAESALAAWALTQVTESNPEFDITNPYPDAGAGYNPQTDSGYSKFAPPKTDHPEYNQPGNSFSPYLK